MSDVPVSQHEPLSPHPLLQAGKGLLLDLPSTLAFLAVMRLTNNLALAVGIATVIGVVQFAVMRARGLPIDMMQMLSPFLVVVFGGASLIFQDLVFYRLKFSLICLTVAVFMLTPGWMNTYLPPIARARAGDVVTAFGYVWSALFFVTAAINIVLARFARAGVWAWFIGVFPLGSKIALILTQYVVTRLIVRRRLARTRACPA
jgi:intracellular septation protein A